MQIKTLNEIYQFLDSISPFDTQESWDNSGIIIGNPNANIKRIALSLEATKEIALQLESDTLLITHHPLIFIPLKNLDFSIYPNNIIEILIKKNISLISMHTNVDISHLNEYFTSKILGFNTYTKHNITCIVECDTTLESLATNIKKHLNSATLKITNANNRIKKIAIICGAGIGEISNEMNIDCIITGDVKYHDAMKYSSLGISIIDVGHYDSECYFGTILAKQLKKIHYNAIMLDSQNPFSYI